MLIGQLDIQVPPIVKVVFFDLFLFATGYKVGPQFFRGLKKNALPQVALTLVLCVTSLVVDVVAAKIFGYDSRTAAGLMAGAFTESTVIGTAGDTISGSTCRKPRSAACSTTSRWPTPSAIWSAPASSSGFSRARAPAAQGGSRRRRAGSSRRARVGRVAR